MTTRFRPTAIPFARSNLLLWLILVLAAFALLVELTDLLPVTLRAWYPYDYERYVQMGNALLANPHSYGTRPMDTVYPLPTQLWVFVPLALLPDWFRVIWVLVPFASLLVVLRARSIIFFLFVPLWFVVSDGMIDGWLILPLWWMIEERPILSGIGAALLLLKPQVAALAIGYMMVHWLLTHNHQNLLAFGLTLFIFCTPAFILDPQWILEMVCAFPVRAEQSVSQIALLGSSIWSWWWLGGVGRIIFVALLVLVVALFSHAIRPRHARTSSFQLLNLSLLFVLFAGSLVTVAPTLKSRRALMGVVAVSWMALALDRFMGQFGGGYALIPPVALWFLIRDIKNAPQS